MSLFFSIFLAIYGLMQVYGFLRARSALAFGPVAGMLLGLFMLLMVFSLFQIRELEQYDYEIPARALAYLAFLWLAVVFLYFCGSLVLDAVGLVVRAYGRIARAEVSAYLLSPRTSFLFSLGLSLFICVYGYFEAQDIRTERIRIETKKLPHGIDRLTIVQISDMHLGLIVKRPRLSAVLDLVRSARPDILISSGDLVDAYVNHLTGLAEQLREFPAPYGNYAVSGNHEYYAGIDKSLTFTRDAGFTVLRNEARDAGPVIIAGVDDLTAARFGPDKPAVEKELLERLPRDRFIIFVKHQPRIDPSTVGLFDLQMSGHTHKGQIFPFTLITLIRFPLNAGTYDLGKGSLLHVSRGAGTWGPPIRFLAPPEVTIYELVRKVN